MIRPDYFGEVCDEYISYAQNQQVGLELIPSLMLIAEIRKVHDELGWLSLKVKEEVVR